MTKFGYAISSEEHHPLEIVRQAQMAEAVGFSFAMISDHYHPWVSVQGHSPFVWSVIGALANATKRLIIGTGVTARSYASTPPSSLKPPQPARPCCQTVSS